MVRVHQHPPFPARSSCKLSFSSNGCVLYKYKEWYAYMLTRDGKRYVWRVYKERHGARGGYWGAATEDEWKR